MAVATRRSLNFNKAVSKVAIMKILKFFCDLEKQDDSIFFFFNPAHAYAGYLLQDAFGHSWEKSFQTKKKFEQEYSL